MLISSWALTVVSGDWNLNGALSVGSCRCAQYENGQGPEEKSSLPDFHVI